jgi:hypothetical protein
MKKKILVLLFIFLSFKLFSWVPTDFALLTWNLDPFLSEEITNALGKNYSVIEDNSIGNFTNVISGDFHSITLQIVWEYEGSEHHPVIVFLYPINSSFDDAYEDNELDHIRIRYDSLELKIGCIGESDYVLSVVKQVILDQDYNLYKPYEL